MNSTPRRWGRTRQDKPRPLFDAAPASRAGTSRAAAVSIADAVGMIESRILDFLRDRGTHGSTAEEAASALALRMQTASARISELGKSSRIMASGRTRATSSGRQAIVWIAPTSHGGAPCRPAS